MSAIFQTAGQSSRRRFLKTAVIAALVAFSTGMTTNHGEAHGYNFGDITIGHIWSPPPKADADGVPVYGPLFNRGADSVHLVGASSSIADEVRIRKSTDGGVTWPDGIDLRPGKPLAMAAWREHIWLSGLHKPLKEGDSFDLTLDFGETGKVKVEVIVGEASGHS